MGGPYLPFFLQQNDNNQSLKEMNLRMRLCNYSDYLFTKVKTNPWLWLYSQKQTFKGHMCLHSDGSLHFHELLTTTKLHIF